jgi:anti-sigma factor RsiW
MTDCPNGQVRDLLPDLLHDRLAPDVRRDVEVHLGRCIDCQEELALLRTMRSSLRRAPSVDVATIAAAIPPYRPAARRAWAGWRVAAAITILAAGGASVAVLQRGDDPGLTGGRIAAATQPVTQPAVPSHPDSVNPLAPSSAPAPTIAPRELALASSAIGDLNDVELSALIEDIGTLDAVPSVDVESSAPVSPVAPTGTE